MDQDKKQREWTLQWKNWVRRTRLPGIWERKEGGYIVRARAIDPTTGLEDESRKVMPEADERAALRWQMDEAARIRAGTVVATPLKTRFAEFAPSLFARKVKAKEIRSARGVDKWENTLEHLIEGTTGKKSGLHVTGFGDFFMDKMHVSITERWKADVAGLIEEGDYSPTTCNGWLSILRVIDKAAKRELGLPGLFTDGVKDFDESEHETYTEEEPNSLLPEEVPVFLSMLYDLYPQHYAMTFLGLATGLRPSSLRPLRRTGPKADILWEKSKLLVRRSHSLGDDVMNTTKQKVRYKIHLPDEVMQVLRWHVETQLATPEQRESELLFPAITGGFRSPCSLNKPFAEVAQVMELGKQFTQRGLRRTFNDLARGAKIEAVITRSISGHLTEKMQHHYSTVNADEQRTCIAKVIDLMQFKQQAGASGTPSGTPAPSSGTPNEKAG